MAGFFGKGDKHNQWIAKAEVAYEKGLYDDASDLFSKAAEAEPENANLWLKLATSKRYAGKYDAALRAYAKAVEANPNATDAWVQLAILYGDTGNYEAALSAVSHVVIPDSELYLRERKCEWLERTGKYGDAAIVATGISNSVPTNKTYRRKAADLLLRSGKYFEAQKIYDELSELHDEHEAKYRADAGLCSELMGDVAGALFRYQHVAEDDVVALYNKARLEESSGHFLDAATTYSKIQQMFGNDDITIVIRRIFSLIGSGNNKEAAQLLEKIISRTNSSPELWYLLGSASFINGSLTRAAEAFDTLVHMGKATPSLWYMKGAVEYLIGRYQDAVESFEKTSRGGAKGNAQQFTMFNEHEMGLFSASEKEPSPIDDARATNDARANNVTATESLKVSSSGIGYYSEDNFGSEKSSRQNNGYNFGNDDEFGQKSSFGQKSTFGTFGSDKNVYDKNVKFDFLTTNTGLLSMQATALAAIGRYADANKAARSVLDADSSRADMDVLRLRCFAVLGKHDGEMEAFKKAVSKLPDDYTILYSHAENLMLSGDYASAKAVWEQLLDICPENSLIYSRLIQSAMALGDYENAISFAKSRLEDTPNDVVALTAAGEAEFAVGNYEQAASHYQKAAEKSPKNPGLQLSLGKALSMQGKFDEAREAFKRASDNLIESSHASYKSSSGTDTTVLKSLSGIRIMEAKAAEGAYDIDDAISIYMDVLKDNPEIEDVAGLVARLAYSAGRFTYAADAATYAVEKNDEDFSLVVLAGDACIAADRVEEAISHYEKAAKMRPENTAVQSSLAHAFIAQGEFSAALETLKKITSSTASPRAYYEKAVCEVNLKMISDAEETLLILVDIDPENQAALLLLADVYEKIGEYDKVIDTFARYLELNPDNVEVYRKVSAIYRMRGDMENALACYELIIERCENDIVTRRFMATALFALGRYEEAAKTASAILEIGDDDAVRNLYAEALYNLGDTAGALTEYTTILKNDSKRSRDKEGANSITENLGLYLTYAHLLSRTGDYARAETAYSRILQQFPKNEFATLEHLMNAVKVGNIDAIAVAFKDASTANSKNPALLSGLGYLMLVSGRPNEALSFFDKAEAAGSHDIDLYCSRAVIYLAQSRFDLAEKAASDALKQQPRNKTALHLKARALESLGRITEAVGLYNRIVNEYNAINDGNSVGGAINDGDSVDGAINDGDDVLVPKVESKSEQKRADVRGTRSFESDNYGSSRYSSDNYGSDGYSSDKHGSNSYGSNSHDFEESNKRRGNGGYREIIIN